MEEKIPPINLWTYHYFTIYLMQELSQVGRKMQQSGVKRDALQPIEKIGLRAFYDYRGRSY